MIRFAPRVVDLTTVDQVRATMGRMGVDPAGIVRMVGKAQWVNILVEAVPCVVANILKQEMLAIGADAAVARGSVACSCVHTDVLLMGTLKQFGHLIKRLPFQPFHLPQLADELQAVLDHRLLLPTHLYGRGCCLTLDRPQVMGVINVTPDSFYDGGSSLTLDDALYQAQQQVESGADILDIGGESTRPGSASVCADVEIERILPVISAIRDRFSVPLSVDTNKASVARAAIDSGASFVNDISGLMFDPDMASSVAQSGAGLFVMHTRGRPDVMQHDTEYNDLVGDVITGLRHCVQLALSAGVAADKLSIDPGIGFGKSGAGNLEILRKLAELRCLGYPILLGTSRKSFIGSVLNQPQPQQRLNGSLATVALGVASGAQLFRVHDVEATRQVVDMSWAIVHS
ncbi:MAG: dihydropteroate synthase [Thermodesulfobacteriota bacterium]|nr:dihydropteroate synthase [Thermodesulfobacteriota bacterium]